ncbi:MAG: GAF domain-containing protein [Candidatus Cloacimonetes bacterium]|nr:GAF domain-containing protein [Candidatus Cloacimonadota bacterium]
MVDAGQMVKKIQEMRDEGYLSDAILRETVKQIKASSTDYNFVGVYLFNEADNELWLHNYMGESTEHAKIPVGKGVCGTAVAEKKNQNVPDVTAIDNYLACSPRTKSELVVLIRAGDEIFGQIDIDCKKKDCFSQEAQESLELIADKLAEVFVAERL